MLGGFQNFDDPTPVSKPKRKNNHIPKRLRGKTISRRKEKRPDNEEEKRKVNTSRSSSEGTPTSTNTRSSTDIGGQKAPPTTMAVVRAGIQKAYMDGVEFMRTKITETQEELNKMKCSFAQSSIPSDSYTEDYLKKCNDNFLQANNELRRKNIKLEVIDAEIRIVALLNQLRDTVEFDKGEIAFVSEFWENIKNTTEGLNVLMNKFQTNVLERLKMNCISYHDTGMDLDVSSKYTEEISTYISDIERTFTNFRILLKSFDTGVHQDLFTKNAFSEKLLVICDLKAFPILRLIPDLMYKIEIMCEVAQKWLCSDEHYVQELNKYIIQTRTMTKKQEEVLKNQRQRHKRIVKAVKTANILLSNNKEKLQKIETELNDLEDQLSGFRNEKKTKFDEKKQKENMVDFLKLTLTQTKRNYNLQMKRQRLLKQVEDLEEFLVGIERDLSVLEGKIVEKHQVKSRLTEKVETSEKSFGALKDDLDQFSENLGKLEQDMNILSGQLLQLEIIQTYKTSPENLDQMFDRPTSVKLAPSLKEKIKRKRKFLAGNK